MRPGKSSTNLSMISRVRSVERSFTGTTSILIFRIFHRHQGVENVGDDFFFVVSGNQHGHGRPVGGVNVDVRVPLETEKAIQREPVVAAGVDADDENNGVENIDHGAQPRPRTRILRASLLACAAALRALSSESLFRRRGCRPGRELELLVGL